MPLIIRTMYLVSLILGCLPAAGADPVPGEPDPPFWLAPKLTIEGFSPTAVKLVSVPDRSQPFALLQVGDIDPKTFVVGNPKSVPFLTREDSGYGVTPGGLKVGAVPFGDRKYKIEKLPKDFSGLPLLRTRMGDKAILDGRFAVILSAERACYVFVALDERALEIYKRHGAPGWLQEFAPTGHRVETDDPLMADAKAGYAVFARKAPAGRVTLGPPCMDVDSNSMYFAFFAEGK
jgi:hypothetical protein